MLTRSGIDLGSFWDPFWGQNRPKKFPQIEGGAVLTSILSFDDPKMTPRPFQEGFWGGLGPSWGGLRLLLGAPEPSLEGLGGLLGRLEGVLGCSWGLLGSLGTILAAHEAINGSFWVVLVCDSLIPFIDSIH